MSEGQKVATGLVAYLLAAIVTFGHAHNWYTEQNLCEETVWCSSPGERAVHCALLWPFYWSMTAWRDEQ